MSNTGKDCSDIGSTTVINQKQCQLAAQFYGKKFGGILQDLFLENFPEGCILKLSPHEQAVYWIGNGKLSIQLDTYRAICYKSMYTILNIIPVYIQI